MDQQQHHNQQHQPQNRKQNQQQQQPKFATPIASTVSDNMNSVPTMYHHQQQQQQQQHIAAVPVTVVSNAMSSQVMGQLMTNPALAAVAAATPLLPPAAMMTNPGAFLTMPEYYRMTNPVMNGNTNDPNQQQQQQQQLTAKISAAAINSSVGVVRPQQVTAGQQQTQQQQQQQYQQHQQQSQPAQIFTVPGMQYPAILPYVTLSNSVLAATPGVNPMAPSSVQVHMAANAAASQAIAAANANNNNGSTNLCGSSSNNIPTANFVESCAATTAGEKRRTKDLTANERAQQNRDRNREHARSTRLRKKAYVSKLKELVEGLHAERTEEVRQRRVAIQHLAETQDVRRAVVRSFLRFQSSYETDKRKWMTLLEDDFWLKQPVTPYRCFRRSEIKNVSNYHFHYRNLYYTTTTTTHELL
jgi:hypothetical protein